MTDPEDSCSCSYRNVRRSLLIIRFCSQKDVPSVAAGCAAIFECGIDIKLVAKLQSIVPYYRQSPYAFVQNHESV
jgi:hypothetical protein